VGICSFKKFLDIA